MRAAWDTLDAETQALIRDMICEHSRLFSRGELGYTFTEDERREFAPVQQRQSEPVAAAAVRTQRLVQAQVAPRVQAAAPALRRPAAVQALAAETAARPARWSSRRA